MTQEEQEKTIEEYRERFIKIGLDTGRADKSRAEAAVRGIYECGNKQLAPDFPFIWVESPYAACSLISILETHEEEGVALLKRHRDEKNNRDVVPTQEIKALVEKLGVKVTYCKTNFWGQHESYWVAFYQCGKALGAKYNADDDKRLGMWDELCRSTGWWWAFNNRVVFSDKPTQVHRENGVLHREDGMAVQYTDGWGMYCSNGIRMPARIMETPKEQLDPLEFSQITNTGIRREFVRKVGIERIFWTHESELVDGPKERNGSTYELHRLRIGDENPREFLKFQNASRALHGHLADVWHIEGVPPGTLTVDQALEFRNGRKDAPAQLT